MFVKTTVVIVCLLCFGLSSAIGWSRNFTSEIGGYTFSSEAMYVLQKTDTIVAVDLNAGNILWTWNVTKENKCPGTSGCYIQSNIKFDSDSGILVVITVTSNMNLFPRAATFFGLLQTGEIKWSVPITMNNNGGIITTTNAGYFYIVSSSQIQVGAYDCATGKSLWQTTDIPALDTACFMGGWISVQLAVDPLLQIITYHCGPIIAAWDNKGQSLWTSLTRDSNWMSYKLAPKSILISNQNSICSKSTSDFTENWCVPSDFTVVSAIDPMGSFIVINETNYFSNIVCLSAHDSQGKFLWGSPSVIYTGVVEILQSAMWGPLGNYYWVPGQPGGLYVMRATDGMIVNQPDVNMFADQDARVVRVDENGVVTIMGNNYVQVVPTTTKN